MKSTLAAIDPNFPVREWDRLLPQIEITLNLLRTSRSNPKLSAYAYMNGNEHRSTSDHVIMNKTLAVELIISIMN